MKTKDQDYIYSKQFIKQYWDQLIEIGIPMVVLEDLKNWTYLIEHGDVLPIINFGLKDLDNSSLIKLYDIAILHDEYLTSHLNTIISNKIPLYNYKCPCCGIFDYEEEIGGTYFICPICGWEDDAIQLRNPDYIYGANKYSLYEARINFLKYGNADGKK